jgi:hypothetical protein
MDCSGRHRDRTDAVAARAIGDGWKLTQRLGVGRPADAGHPVAKVSESPICNGADLQRRRGAGEVRKYYSKFDAAVKVRLA